MVVDGGQLRVFVWERRGSRSRAADNFTKIRAKLTNFFVSLTLEET